MGFGNSRISREIILTQNLYTKIISKGRTSIDFSGKNPKWNYENNLSGRQFLQLFKIVGFLAYIL
jgi:hypothetical protein